MVLTTSAKVAPAAVSRASTVARAVSYTHLGGAAVFAHQAKEQVAVDILLAQRRKGLVVHNDNVGGHMLFGMMGKNCRTTIINGRVLYKDREFVGIDEDKINAWTMAESKKLWSTLNDRTY